MYESVSRIPTQTTFQEASNLAEKYCGSRQKCCWRGTSVLAVSEGNLGTALTTILPAATVYLWLQISCLLALTLRRGSQVVAILSALE